MSNVNVGLSDSSSKRAEGSRKGTSKGDFQREARNRRKHNINGQHVLLFLVAFRILNALCVKTFFQPDEFYQSLEPAWQIAFGGESGAWITWEWKHQLRSSIHPYIFAAIYRASSFIADTLKLLPLNRAELLIAAPKVTQATFAAVGDYYTWKLAGDIFGIRSSEAWWTLGLTVLSPWQWFCSTRTLSNCLETTLTVTALYLWPWRWATSEYQAIDMSKGTKNIRAAEKSQRRKEVIRLRKCLLLAAFACILRPTNLIIWLCLMTYDTLNIISRNWRNPRSLTTTAEPMIIVIREALCCGAAVLSQSVLADRIYYGIWTLPPFRFLYFNIAQSLAGFYGNNDWHYYLSQGYPLLLTTALPFALVGIAHASVSRPPPSASLPLSMKRRLALICMLMPMVLSLIAHKEVRFIYPLLPCLHILAASPISNFFSPAISSSSSSYTPRRLILIFLVLVNVTVAIYTTFIHASGSLNVMNYLRLQHDRLSSTPESLKPRFQFYASASTSSVPDASRGLTAGFLMPCHSTPWRSHLITPSIRSWALTCEPPVNLSIPERASYVDEADQFYDNPTEYMRKNMVGGLKHLPRTPSYLLSRPPTPEHSTTWSPNTVIKHEWPDYLIFFSHLEPTLQTDLSGSSYAECYRTFNTAWHDDWRRKGDIIVWCLDPAVQQDWRTKNTRVQVASQNKAQKKQQKHFDRIVDRLMKETDSGSWWGTRRKQDILSSLSISLPSPSWGSKPGWWAPSPWSPKRTKTWRQTASSMFDKLMPRRRNPPNSLRDLWS